MEIACGLLRRSAIGRGFVFPPVGVGGDQNTPPSSFALAGPWKKRRRKESDRLSVSGGYSNEGHLRYYAYFPMRRGGWGKNREEREKERLERRRARLVKDLSKDLSALCAIGFGVEDHEAVAGEGRGKIISEAAELLLEKLNQLRVQEEESKMRRKEERAILKSAKMNFCVKDRESSSSSESSSESSDSECEELVDMSSLKAAMPILEVQTENLSTPSSSFPTCNPCSQPPVGKQLVDQQINPKIGQEWPSACSTFSSSIGANVCDGKSAPTINKPINNKIEICLGGKCKKSGALDLMAEFKKEIGIEGAVVGCKCMGKCRQGPCVRLVVAQGEGEDKDLKNPMCIGVGLEDVSTIVANMFEDKNFSSF